MAALVLIIGGMMLFEFSDPETKPVWQVCTVPVIKPPPTNSSCHNGQPFGPNR